jgi:protein tyrosine phosphatase (PTP) superfamily phosphohydrolase (DUF442 family)
MDSKDKEQQPRIEAEKKLLEQYNIPFTNISVSSIDNRKEIEEVKKLLKTIRKPVVVHRFFTDNAGDSAIIQALKQ